MQEIREYKKIERKKQHPTCPVRFDLPEVEVYDGCQEVLIA